MRIGWRTYLKQAFRKKSAYHAVGIAISLDTVTFCALSKKGDALHVVHEETVSFGQWGKSLIRWAEKHNLVGTPTYVAFSIHSYQILQIDRPAVEPEEMVAAMSWSVKELTGSDQEMVIDYIDLPVPLAGASKVNVIALPKKDVAVACEYIFDSGLTLQQITVEELATCNLVETTSDAILTLVQEAGEEICLNIVKNGQLYLSRRLKGFENLGSFSKDELQMGIGESLSVQVQRSMDFYESQLRQAPVRRIQLRLDTQHIEALSLQINQVVSAEVEELIPAGIVSDTPLPVHRLNYTSLGAALGAEVAEVAEPMEASA